MENGTPEASSPEKENEDEKDVCNGDEKDMGTEKELPRLPPEEWSPSKPGKLPPSEWTPSKKSDIMADELGGSLKREKKKFSYDEVIQLLEEKIKVNVMFPAVLVHGIFRKRADNVNI